MRSSLLYLLTFFIIGIANAQGPTITANIEAIPGDILTYIQESDLTGIVAPATGANITWDYSGLSTTGIVEIDTFVAPSSTPSASLFPGTNLALELNGFYEYFQATATDWSTMGAVFPGFDTAFFKGPLSDFHFPFSYGSTYTDSAQETEGYLNPDTTENIVYSQAVGYGTLKVPGHTYANVLMVKDFTTQRDQFNDLYTYTSIYFLTPGVHSFIMEIDLDDLNNVSAIEYLATGTIIQPTSYTFNGNGDWEDAANWVNGKIPPSVVPSGSQVTINPEASGFCFLEVPVTFTTGATLTVSPGALFYIMGNLIINK